MSKPITTSKPSATKLVGTTKVAAPLASSPAPKKQDDIVAVAEPSAPAFDASGLDDKQLRELIKRLNEERKARAAAAKASGLAVGTRVIVRDPKSKWNGKEGVVILSRKVRCFVQFPSVLSPANVKVSDVEEVPQ